MPVAADNILSNPLSGKAAGSNNRRNIFLTALALALAVLAAYHNVLDKPFVFDDEPAILENPTITQLWPPWTALTPPPRTGSSVGGRPLVNYSFALNYAVSGYEVWSYHALNLIIHVLVTWTLFGIVRRTLLLPTFAPRCRAEATLLAFLTALAWAVHPLLTETVTFVVQRTESLGALFYLLTLYSFIRSLDGAGANAWRVAAAVACLIGVATKETVVTVPVVVLLFDRTFVAGTFTMAWRMRRKFYAALVGSWLLLAWLMLHAQQRGGTAGFGLGMAWWQYALKQCAAVTDYLALAVWPHPLAVDYGYTGIASLSAVWLQALALGILLGVTGWAVVRRPMAGFVGAWVFIILAPSSSIVPITTQTEAEHRMYLPLAALVALAIITLYAWVGRRALAWVAIVALAWGWLTFQRNTDSATVTGLWRSNVAAVPTNARAHDNLAAVLMQLGRGTESIQEYNIARQLDPASATTENSLGAVLSATGHLDEALGHYRRAVDLSPDNVVTHANLGNLLKQLGRVPEAIVEYREALRVQPDSAEVKMNLGDAYNLTGHPETALPYYQYAVARKPASAQAQLGLGNAWALLNHWEDAKKAYAMAVKIDPKDYGTRYSLGLVLSHLGDTAAARREYEEVLREHPEYSPARRSLAELPSGSDGSSSPPATR
jgi:tetratricopeptide (TPR) repeat protein